MYKVKHNDRQLRVELESEGKALVDGRPVSYDLHKMEPGRWHVISNHQSFNVQLVERNDAEKTITLLINNRPYTVELRDQLDDLLEKMGMSGADALQLNELKAPMPGLVMKVVATPGTAVQKGDNLLILEAMKMENVIKAPAAANVTAVHIEQGQTVEKNQLLMSFGL